MSNAWSTYKAELFKKMPSLSSTLNSGADENSIKAAEEEIGVSFGTELRELYLANDGDDHEALCGAILGFQFLTLEELLSEWRDWKDFADDESLNAPDRFTSVPEGCIKRRYADTKWLPLFTDNGGNFIGVDLDPDVKGTPGQIINFGRDEHDKAVLAESLGMFFERLTRIVRSSDFHIGEFDGEEVIYLGPDEDDEENDSYLTDYLLSDESVK